MDNEDIANLIAGQMQEGSDNEIDLFDTLVGDDKKFKTAEDLAKSKILADAHIQRIQEENADLRKKLDDKKRLQDLMTELNLQPNVDDADDANEKPIVAQVKEIDEDSLVNKVLGKIKDQEFAKTAKVNQEILANALQSSLGDEWQSKVRELIKGSGIPEDILSGLAKTNPKAFMKALDITPNQETVNSTSPTNAFSFTNTVNTASVPKPGDPNVKDQSYYRKLKAQDPQKFWDPKIQIEMHQQAMKLKERFFA